MKLFIVASIYQFFNMVRLTQNDSKNTDVVLMKTEKNFVDCINIDKLKEYYGNVYICNFIPISNNLIKLLYILKNTYGNSVFGCKIIKKYDEIYLAGTESISKTVATRVLSSNGSFYYYEDGLETYCSVLDPKVKRKIDFVFKLMHGYYPIEKCKKVFVYEPKAIDVNPLNISCQKIDKIDRNREEKLKKLLCELYICQPFIINKKVIFLNAWFNTAEEYNLQNKMLTMLVNTFGAENICVKTHPNELKDIDRLSGVEYIESKCCFEVSNLFQDWTDKIFVSMESTAAITPSMIFGDRPQVVFFNKIFQKEFPKYEEVLGTIELFKNLYKGISAPNDMQEFQTILEKLSIQQE